MPVINEHFTINTQGNNDIINITKHVQNRAVVGITFEQSAVFPLVDEESGFLPF